MSGKPSSVVERFLAERIGLDASTVGDGLIVQGVQTRMTALGLRSRADYDRVLIDQPDEWQALVEEVVVPESWFFRDDRPFEVLTEFARSGWLADPARPPLSALSVPCAGGEEPYSIAMTLLEAGLPSDRFRVDAMDVSVRSLTRAISGVYGRNSFRGSTSLPRSRFFQESNGAFTLDPSVRSSVRFHLGNVLSPEIFADGPAFDVVFCRNLLIYLNDESKIRALTTLSRLVVDGGLLFLGHADRFLKSANLPFELTCDRGSFAYRKGAITKASSAVAIPSRKPAVPAPLVKLDKPVVPRSVPPQEVKPPLAPEPKPNSGPKESASTVLDRASSLADIGRYNEARAVVDGLIREGGASARAHFLLGLIDQSAGLRDQAEVHYLKAIYLDPQHDEALLALALLARRKGDIAAESAYRKRADRVLARKVSP